MDAYKSNIYCAILKRVQTTKEESSSNRADTGGSVSGCSARTGGGGGGTRGATAGRRGSTLGFLLEGVKGLICSRVDGEDHSVFAMGAGLAVEPGWGGAVNGVVEGGGCAGSRGIFTI